MEARNFKILIVEDDKVDVMAMKRHLVACKDIYAIDIAGSIKEARDKMKANRYDVVISDYRLPDGESLELIKDGMETPMIIITGSGDEVVAGKFIKYGVSDYLIKDIEGEYLNLIPISIKRALSRRTNIEKLKILYEALMSIGDAVYIKDMKDNIIYVNKRFLEVYGYEEDEILGKKSHVLWSEKNSNMNHLIIQEKSVLRGEFIHRKKNGDEFPVLLTKNIIDDRQNKQMAIVEVSRDISEMKKIQYELEQYATKDSLTGLLNRRTGLYLLEREMTRSVRYKESLSIIFADLNRMKYINDNFGHQEGDEVLRKVAKIFKENSRESDIICRLGGDEFILVLPNCDKTNAKHMVNRINDTLEVENKLSAYDYEISISFGVEEYDPDRYKDIDEFVGKADDEMYKNKKKSRLDRDSLKI